MTESTSRRLHCLSTCQKQTSSFTSFLRQCILKNPAIRLGDSNWGHHSRTRIFQIWDWWWNINNNISFYFRLLPRKSNKKILKKSKKPYLGGHFRPVLPKFGQNEFSWKKSCQFLNIPIIYKPAKNKKTNEPFLKSIPGLRVNQISAHLKTLSSLLASHQKVAIT